MPITDKKFYLSELEIQTIASPFIAIKEQVDWTAENKTIESMVDQSLDILTSKGVPIGGSAITNEHIKELLSRIPIADDEKEIQTT